MYINVGECVKKQKRVLMKRIRYFKSEAKSCMLARDNMYKTVLYILVAVMLSASIIYTSGVMKTALENASGPMAQQSYALLGKVLYVILTIIGSFLLFSTLLGTYFSVTKMRCDTDIEPSGVSVTDTGAVLCLLNGKKNLRAAIVMFATAFILCMPVIISFAVLNTARGMIPQGQTAYLLLYTAAAAVAVICAILYLIFVLAMLLPLAYIDYEDMGFGKTLAFCFTAASGNYLTVLKLMLSFIPGILVGIASFGVSLIVYTVPYMTFTLAKAGEYIYLSNTERKKEDT